MACRLKAAPVPAGSNVVSVAEHVVMMMLSLVRNYIPAHMQVINGEWDVAKIAER